MMASNRLNNYIIINIFYIIWNLNAFTLAQLLQQRAEIFPYYYVGCYKSRTDLLKESIYVKLPQTCVDTCEHQTYSYAILSGERCFCSNAAPEEDRVEEILCNTRCMADKTQYCGGAGVHSYYSTRLAKEPTPKHLKVTRATENSLAIMWEAPQVTNKMFIPISETDVMSATMPPQITHFLIKSKLVQTFSTLPTFRQPEFIVQATETSFEITDLQPATIYNISVIAMCNEIACGNASILATTEVGTPSPAPKSPRILSQDAHKITIQIPAIKNDNGPISKIYIIVERIDDTLSQSFDSALLGDWRKAQDDGLPYYITAELNYDNNTLINRKFVVGDGLRYGRFENPPLEPADAHFHISLGVVNKHI